MNSRTVRPVVRFATPNRFRHVMVSTAQDVITELELSGASSEAGYLIRQRHASGGVGQIVDSDSWIGFRYHDDHWSFLRHS